MQAVLSCVVASHHPLRKALARRSDAVGAFVQSQDSEWRRGTPRADAAAAETHEDRRDRRAGLARSRDAALALPRRRERRAAQLLARHARRARPTIIADVRRSRANSDLHVAILQDLPGPKVRTGDVRRRDRVGAARDRRAVHPHDRDGAGRRRSSVSVSYAGLARDVEVGKRIYLADGAIALRVNGIDGPRIDTVVETAASCARGKESTIRTERSSSKR